MECVEIDASARISFAVIVKTLALADREPVLHIERVAYGQVEDKQRVVVLRRLHAIHIVSAGPVLASMPHIRGLRLADNLVLLEEIGRVNR